MFSGAFLGFSNFLKGARDAVKKNNSMIETNIFLLPDLLRDPATVQREAWHPKSSQICPCWGGWKPRAPQAVSFFFLPGWTSRVGAELPHWPPGATLGF